MICPQCKAEYRPGFTRCADCGVELVWEQPSYSGARAEGAAGPGDPNEDPFCSFWKGDDPRIHADLSEVLDEVGIPHTTVFRRDHLFNLNNFPAYQIGVPFSLFEKAENAVKEAFGTEDADAVKLLKAPSEKPDDASLPGPMPRILTPEEVGNIPGPPRARNEDNWYPEDATVQVWTGREEVSANFLVASMHENGIRCRVKPTSEGSKLLVLPGDEARAREIVREVAEGQPPE
jgi:hypothetical protein